MRSYQLTTLLTPIATAMLLACPQYAVAQSERRYVASKDTVAFAFLYQPDCPVAVEDAVQIGFTKGGGYTRLRVRNRDTRPVNEIVYVTINDYGLINTTITDFADSTCPIAPGDTAPASRAALVAGTVTLTESEIRALGLARSESTLLLVAITEVRFADGSIWRDDHAVEAARKQFDQSVPVPPN